MNDLKSKQPKRLGPKSQHPYHMYDMMEQTPDAMKRIITEEINNIKSVAQVLSKKKMVYLIGIGTSLHAALNARFYLKSIGKVNCEAINSLEFILNPPLVLDSECALVIFSQTGCKTYSYQSYLKGKELGVYSVLITSLDSIIEQPMDAIIRTSQYEQSSAYTISHSCSTLTSLLLSNEIARIRGIVNATIDAEILNLPNYFKNILNKSIPEIKEWCKVASNGVEIKNFVAYGGNECNTHEVSLKIQEATYTNSNGYNTEFYLHGPFIATQPSTLSTFIITSTTHPLDSDKNREIIDRTLKSINLVQNVNAKAALILSEDDTTSASKIGKDTILIRGPNVSEPISILTNLFILQLMTYFLALEPSIKTDPDQFRKNLPPFDTAFINADLIL